VSKQSEIIDRLMASCNRPSAKPLEAPVNGQTIPKVADNGTPFNAKRNPLANVGEMASRRGFRNVHQGEKTCNR
jgi:hypothetical protein